jgi:hypothetical protein
MAKSKIDWEQLQLECDLFDLSEYNPKLRGPGLEEPEISEKELDNND